MYVECLNNGFMYVKNFGLKSCITSATQKFDGCIIRAMY